MNVPKTSMQKTSYILDLISKKQEVVSTNMANVDTPNYVRKDMNFSKYLGDNCSMEPAISQQMGIGAVSIDEGGTVDLVNEMMEMQKNSLLYSVAARRMSSIITEMKSATNVGR